MKIVVLAGGVSTERHVSLVTGSAVCTALRKLGHRAILVDLYMGLENFDGPLEAAFDAPDGFIGQVAIEKTVPDLRAVKAARRMQGPSRIGQNVLELCRLADFVFLGLHGADGEDGKIQATLDLLGVPYTGSGPLASGLAMDKAVAKQIMQGAGVRTPKWQTLRYTEADIPRLVEELPVPCAVKVINGGSSIGVELPDTREELEKALRALVRFDAPVIVEEKIRGREITQPILDDHYMSAIEIVPPEGTYFDYVAKYQSGAEGAQEICPARITPEEQQTIGEAALRVHRALGLSVYSRVDFILDDKGLVWCLEVNTLPGMTPASLIPKAAKAEGLSYEELCEKIVQLSLEARRQGL